MLQLLEKKNFNFIRVIHLNWLQKISLRGLGILVVNLIAKYCYTHVLLYVKMLKETETEETIPVHFFVAFLSLVSFQLEGTSPLATPMT